MCNYILRLLPLILLYGCANHKTPQVKAPHIPASPIWVSDDRGLMPDVTVVDEYGLRWNCKNDGRKYTCTHIVGNKHE